ncbi:hypothetical protein SAMN02910356_00085 [Selenomonas sp. GACV-9]|uniref:PcfJ domain-containing protein n=1 Tax=Selenomonas sp. GACV-9 TaxID=3158782 RepID=UPI0008DF104E|nr:hypothetical protein SAMN02910356_00085 [Selenomonas ruminantium]
MDSKLHFPIRESFYFDAEIGQWIADESGLHSDSPPTDEEISLIFPANRNSLWSGDSKKVVWCPLHLRYEPWTSGVRKEHCNLKQKHCILDAVPQAQKMIFATGIWRWWILQESPQDDLRILAEWISVTCEKKFILSKLGSVLIPHIVKVSQAGYKINLFSRIGFEEGLFARRYQDKFPEAVTKRVLEIITELLRIICGRYVMLPQCMEKYGVYTSDLHRIAQFPNDVHISYLQNFLGEQFFEENCLDECADHYLLVCSYIGINPPDSIRKEYLKNPYAIIIYFWLIRLGFKDINAIRLFFCEAIVGRTYFGKVYFDSEYRLIRRFSLPCTGSGMDFVFYVRWMLRNGKGEMYLARQIVKLLSDGWQRWYDDMLKMFHQYYPFLSEETKQIVKKRGICGESHDALVHESYAVDMKRISIDYKSPMIQGMNSFFDGLKFHVVTDTAELPIIGRHLSNCVASYADRMLKGLCVIVTASDSKDYQVCMEITIDGKNEEGLVNKLSLVQCLGRYNRRLQGNLLTACRNWSAQNKIAIACHDI